MLNSLDYRTATGRTVGDIVFAPLEEAKIAPTVVDVGARNGMFFLPASYTRRADLIGFEPNPEEYRKLVAGDTDAMKAGMRMPAFRSLRYFDCAAWDREEERPFYVTAGPGACTMMGETQPEIGVRIFQTYPRKDRRSGKSFLEVHGKVNRTLPMRCRRLDRVLDPEATVDFLKIDTEGAELRVLKGAEGLLERGRILFVYTEFVAVPYYREHPLLGDQHVYLRDHGMRLIDLELGHQAYTRAPTRLSAMADRRLIHAGDAIFVIDPERTDLSAETRQRLAAIALVYGFNSFAIGLMEEARLTPEADIRAIEGALSRPPIERWLNRTWQKVPYAVYGGLRRILGRA
ncbi:MAG: FkbM family methyltransferase [Pseudomonadota bacterium]